MMTRHMGFKCVPAGAQTDLGGAAAAHRVWVLLTALLLAGAVVSCATAVDPKARARAKISYDMGVASLSNGNTRGALRELLQATELDPNFAEAHHALGLVFHAMGRQKEALSHYERGLALNPKFSEAYNNMGTLLIDLGRYDEAIAAFRRALSDILYATPSLAEGNMGWAYYKKGNVDLAMQHLRNAVATNPKFCRGYEWLARIGLDRDDAAMTVRSGRRFQKYCASDSEVARLAAPDYLRQMNYYLGLGLLKQGDRDGARATFASCAVPGDDEPTFGARCAASLRGLPSAP